MVLKPYCFFGDIMPLSIKEIKEYEAIGIPISTLNEVLKIQAYTLDELSEELKVPVLRLKHHMTKDKRVKAKIKAVKVGRAVYYYIEDREKKTVDAQNHPSPV